MEGCVDHPDRAVRQRALGLLYIIRIKGAHPEVTRAIACGFEAAGVPLRCFPFWYGSQLESAVNLQVP